MLIVKEEDVKLEGFIHSHDFITLKNEEECLSRIHKAIDKKEKKVEETKENVEISTRGFYAKYYKEANSRDLEMHLVKKLSTEKKPAENGDYYQEYKVHYKYNNYKGHTVLDIKFNKDNEIIGCKQRPFICQVSKKGDEIEFEYYEAID